jgi:Flp pilus assembly pilin Flp
MKRLLTDTKGAVTTEYIVIVGTVALGFAVALVSVAPQLIADYYRTQEFVADPSYPQ